MVSGRLLHHDDGLCALCGAPRVRPSGHVFGDVTIADGLVTRGGLSVALPPLPFAILEALARRAGRPVSIESLMQIVYGASDDPPDEHVLDVHIHKLRRIIGATAIESRFGLRILRPALISLDADSPVHLPPVTLWGPEDDERLRQLHALGLSWRAIAAEMKLTGAAVKYRCRVLGLRRQRLWTAAQIDALRQLVAEGLNDREIGARLGRSKQSILQKRHSAGIRR